MIPIKGIYEIAVKVSDLKRSEEFYCRVLDLTVGLRDETRSWVFLRIGGDAGMVVLQEENGEFHRQHFAFSVDETAIGHAADILRGRGVTVSEIVFHEWMNAKSVYFDDPDGNSLELCAVCDSLTS